MQLNFSKPNVKSLNLELPPTDETPEGETITLKLKYIPQKKAKEHDEQILKYYAQVSAGEISAIECMFLVIEYTCENVDRIKFENLEFDQIREIVKTLGNLKLGLLPDDVKKN